VGAAVLVVDDTRAADLGLVGPLVVLVVEGLGGVVVGGAGFRGLRSIMGRWYMSDAVCIVIMSYLFRMSSGFYRYHHDLRATRILWLRNTKGNCTRELVIIVPDTESRHWE
jgi:hypothetical protein